MRDLTNQQTHQTIPGDTRVRRSSRLTKSKEPQRFGDPVKHSIKEISEEEPSGGALLKAASQDYRKRLEHFKTRNDISIETRLGLLERHLFRRKFGYATIDEGVDWNPTWRIELVEDMRIKLKKTLVLKLNKILRLRLKTGVFRNYFYYEEKKFHSRGYVILLLQ